MKNSSHKIRNRDRDLPECSAVVEPTAPLFTPGDTHINNFQSKSWYILHFFEEKSKCVSSSRDTKGPS